MTTATATFRVRSTLTPLGCAAIWACDRLAARIEGGSRAAAIIGRAFAFAVLRAPPHLLFSIRAS